MTITKKQKLIEKRDQLNARIQKIQALENAKKRKVDTQVKILLGAALLTRLDQNDERAQGLLVWCKSALSQRDQERLEKGMEGRR